MPTISKRLDMAEQEEQEQEDIIELPFTKKIKPNYKLCGHCDKELSEKIFKEHKRLYYDLASKSWTRDESDECNSSSEFSSLDEFSFTLSCDKSDGSMQDSDNFIDASDQEEQLNSTDGENPSQGILLVIKLPAMLLFCTCNIVGIQDPLR